MWGRARARVGEAGPGSSENWRRRQRRDRATHPIHCFPGTDRFRKSTNPSRISTPTLDPEGARPVLTE